jgi:hypothetical protein
MNTYCVSGACLRYKEPFSSVLPTFGCQAWLIFFSIPIVHLANCPLQRTLAHFKCMCKTPDNWVWKQRNKHKYCYHSILRTFASSFSTKTMNKSGSHQFNTQINRLDKEERQIFFWVFQALRWARKYLKLLCIYKMIILVRKCAS